MLIVAYHLAFSKTIAIKKEIKVMELQILKANDLNSNISNLYNREKYIDSIIINNNIKNSSTQNNLLGFLNESSEKSNFTIKNFNEPHVFIHDNFKKTSFLFSIQGYFNEIEEVVFNLEQNYNFGKIVHLKYEKKRNHRLAKDYLECFIVLESINSN